MKTSPVVAVILVLLFYSTGFSQSLKLGIGGGTAFVQSPSADWYHHFAASAQDVGEDELRKLWSSILAQEATQAGKFSKRTLDYLKNFSVKDCRLFEKLRPYLMVDEHGSYFFCDLPRWYDNRKGLDYLLKVPMATIDTESVIHLKSYSGV